MGMGSLLNYAGGSSAAALELERLRRERAERLGQAMSGAMQQGTGALLQYGQQQAGEADKKAALAESSRRFGVEHQNDAAQDARAAALATSNEADRKARLGIAQNADTRAGAQEGRDVEADALTQQQARRKAALEKLGGYTAQVQEPSGLGAVVRRGQVKDRAVGDLVGPDLSKEDVGGAFAAKDDALAGQIERRNTAKAKTDADAANAKDARAQGWAAIQAGKDKAAAKSDTNPNGLTKARLGQVQKAKAQLDDAKTLITEIRKQAEARKDSWGSGLGRIGQGVQAVKGFLGAQDKPESNFDSTAGTNFNTVRTRLTGAAIAVGERPDIQLEAPQRGEGYDSFMGKLDAAEKWADAQMANRDAELGGGGSGAGAGGGAAPRTTQRDPERVNQIHAFAESLGPKERREVERLVGGGMDFLDAVEQVGSTGDNN